MNAKLTFRIISLILFVCITVTACSFSKEPDSGNNSSANSTLESIHNDSADNITTNGDAISNEHEVTPDVPSFEFPEKVRVLLLAPGKKIIHSKKDVEETSYPGTMEIYEVDGGYVYVNEVSLEDYVKGVLPGEMPESFGLEALKAQAVCARTYVCSKNPDGGYPEFDAIVDDSTNYQVYYPQNATSITNQAVDETCGQILMKDSYPIEALYFSTSCGFTQTTALFPLIEDQELLDSVYVSSSDEYPSVDYDEYLRNPDPSAYEDGEKYFRWRIRIDTKEKSRAIINKIDSLTDESNDIIYSDEILEKVQYAKRRCYSISPAFGKLLHMDVLSRDDGGVISSLLLTFENGTVTINDQLKLRRILGSAITAVQLNDGSMPENVSILYSGAFTWDVGANGQYVLYGGGYGHGCGMSQYAAGKMGKSNYSYQDILDKFYPNAELVSPD